LEIFLGEKNIEKELEIGRQKANWTRYQPGQGAGHYESFFQRANHPTRPMAFSIRYTIFSPQNHPENAVGELLAIYQNVPESPQLCWGDEWPPLSPGGRGLG